MNIIDDIKERVSMLDVLQLYGQCPVRGRNNYRCFAHDDRRPSAGLTKSGDKFHCFACGYTGNIFDVVQHFEKCDLKTAMRILDDKFNLGLCRELSHKEKLELARQMKERERERQEKLWWEQYEKVVLADIIKELRRYEDLEIIFRIEKGQYRGEWGNEFGDTYFYVLKELNRLDNLYDEICDSNEESKRELLAKIKDGKIVV